MLCIFLFTSSAHPAGTSKIVTNAITAEIRACLHIPSPSNSIIMSMETHRLIDRMGSKPILTVIIHITSNHRQIGVNIVGLLNRF